MHHARHGRYQGSLSETRARILRISDGGENEARCAFRYFFLSQRIKGHSILTSKRLLWIKFGVCALL
jgi:hypothetical protein